MPFLFSANSHGKKDKSLIHKEKNVLKGKIFPFIRRKTTHRPRKKFRLKLFFLSYMLPPSSKIIAHAIPLRHIVPFFCPLRKRLYTIHLQ